MHGCDSIGQASGRDFHEEFALGHLRQSSKLRKGTGSRSPLTPSIWDTWSSDEVMALS